MLGHFGEKFIARAGYLVKASLDRDDTFPDTGNRYELLEDWSIHRRLRGQVGESGW
jgi:hypothetical protein